MIVYKVGTRNYLVEFRAVVNRYLVETIRFAGGNIFSMVAQIEHVEAL